ncbi:MAG: type I-E CRISPR-associated protein Cas5/CasD [Microthrixaceae bacterium]
MELSRTLGLALHGPLQSWGAHSKLGVRETGPTPTRSGVLGMVRAALGDPRDGDQELLSALDRVELAVRVDRPGDLVRDLHNTTAGPAFKATGTAYAETIMSVRWYLSDAAFLVVMAVPEPDEAGLVDRIAAALEHPRWHLCLGRRSCPPTEPFTLGVVPVHPLDVLCTAPVMCSGGPPEHLSVALSGALAAEAARRGWDPTVGSTSMTRPLPGRRWAADVVSGFRLPNVEIVGADPTGLAQWFQEART